MAANLYDSKCFCYTYFCKRRQRDPNENLLKKSIILHGSALIDFQSIVYCSMTHSINITLRSDAGIAAMFLHSQIKHILTINSDWLKYIYNQTFMIYESGKLLGRT